ncbi:MAG: ABC transporter permease [Gemmatimonadota bacterium]|nr:MAG: ABC transporter permease [Gemmatimonadota bacterium]
MTALLKDFELGLRALLKKPGSSAISIVAFGLGIGLCATMFSIIYGVYFRGIGVPEADRLTLIFRSNPSENIERMWVHQHDFYDWREQQRSFEALAGFSTGTINVSGSSGQPERFEGAFVSANLFDVLRVAPVLGSSFRPGDDAPGAPLTALIGYGVWTSRYESDPSVIGRLITVNGEQATILGVLPDGFMFPQTEEIWVPRRDSRAEYDNRGAGPWFQVVGRLKDGITLGQAGLDMSLVAQRLAQAYPESNEGVGVTFFTFVEQSIGDEAIPVFAAMQIATVFVLLIACANVANLLLSRAALRTKEAAVRTALGARRWRVAMPLFSEAAILSLCGAALGIAIAYVGVDLFDRATTGVGKPYFMVLTVDLPILGFIVAVTVLTAFASGIVPAIQTARTDVNSILKDENRGSSSFRAGKLSKVLVIGEVALSCALLVGAGLMTKSITKLNNYQFDFAIEDVFTARVGIFETDYPTAEERRAFFRDLKERLQAVPAARSVALTNMLPTVCCSRSRFLIEGEVYETDQEQPRSNTASVSPDFFTTFGVGVLRGRDFNLMDDANSGQVAIVNRRFAEKFFPNEDAVGRRIKEGFSGNTDNWDWRTIVGVVPNLKMEGFDPDEDDPAGYYVPLAQRDLRFVSIAVQVAGGSPLSITPEVRAAVRGADADLPIYFVRDMDGVIHQETWFYNVFGTLFIVFGIAALFLASVGLYGVLSFSVSRRIQEMGLRMALGAMAKDVIRLVLREGATQLGIGLALGLALAFLVSKAVALVMFDVQPRDPMVYGAIVATIILVGISASLVPALRATRVDPMVALRYE